MTRLDISAGQMRAIVKFALIGLDGGEQVTLREREESDGRNTGPFDVFIVIHRSGTRNEVDQWLAPLGVSGAFPWPKDFKGVPT